MDYLGRLVVLVHDLDEACAFYRDALGLTVLFDASTAHGRMVHLGLRDDRSGVWLLPADTPAQRALVGRQAGNQPLGVLYTMTLNADIARLARQGVPMLGAALQEGGTRYCHFEDLHGNRWVLVQAATKEEQPWNAPSPA